MENFVKFGTFQHCCLGHNNLESTCLREDKQEFSELLRCFYCAIPEYKEVEWVMY